MPDTQQRCALYCRTSERYQQTLEAQLVDCRRVCARDGAVVVAELSDQESGLVETRDGYQELLNLARRGAIDRVVVWKFDRFGRSQVENTARLQELLRLRVSIVSCMEGAIDEFLGGLLSVFAQRESRNISDRVLLKMRSLAAQGRNLTTPAFGYRTIPGRPGFLEDVPHEAALVREMYMRWVGEDVTMQGLADWLNAQCHPETGEPIRLCGGGVFTQRWVKAALTSPRYIGQPVWGKRRTGNLDARHSRPQSQHVHVDAATAPEARGVPALVDRALWDAAQERMQSRTRGAGGPARKLGQHDGERYLLTGFLLCGACVAAGRRGTRMTTERHRYQPQDSTRERLPLYRCPRHLKGAPRCSMGKRSALRVDGVVRRAIATLHVPASFLARAEAAERARAARTPAVAQLAQERAALARLHEQHLQLGLDKLAGVFTAEEYLALAGRLKPQIAAAQQRIATLERQHAGGSLVAAAQKGVPVLAALASVMTDGTLTAQRQVLAALVDGVVLAPGQPLQVRLLWKEWVVLLADAGVLRLPPEDEAPLVTTAEAACLLGISRTRVAQLVRAGRIPAVKEGERWLLRRDDLARLPARLPGRPRRLRP